MVRGPVPPAGLRTRDPAGPSLDVVPEDREGELFADYAPTVAGLARNLGLEVRCARFPIPDLGVPAPKGMEEILEAGMPFSPFTSEIFTLAVEDAAGRPLEVRTRLFEPSVSRRRSKKSGSIRGSSWRFH